MARLQERDFVSDDVIDTVQYLENIANRNFVAPSDQGARVAGHAEKLEGLIHDLHKAAEDDEVLGEILDDEDE